MKILQVNGYLGCGGAEKLIVDFVENIHQNIKCDVVILSEKNNFYLERLKNGKKNVYSLTKEKLYSPLNILRLVKLIKKEKYDIVHAHTFPANYITAFASIFCRNTKFIYTEHSTHNRRRDKKILRNLEKFIYSKFEKIICISAKTEENLRKYLENDSNKIITIENGINLKKFQEAVPLDRKKINKNLKETDILVTMVGRFSHQKDQKTLVKSMVELPENYKLLLVGEGESLDQCKKEVEELKLQERVFFLGVRRDVERIFKTSDIAVISSKWEGFGLVAVEAMACGIPVLGTDVDGLREVIGNEGYLFPVGDYKKLSKKIVAINEMKHTFVDNCKKYSLEKMVDRYLKVYLEK